jgi:hypothetical protein
LATQLEEPFTILPMQAFCDKIYKWCTEIVSFAPGDNNNVDKIPTSQAGVESVLMNGDAINAIN